MDEWLDECGIDIRKWLEEMDECVQLDRVLLTQYYFWISSQETVFWLL